MKKRRSRWENIPGASSVSSKASELDCSVAIARALSEFIQPERYDDIWHIPVVWNKNLKNTAGYYISGVVRTHEEAGLTGSPSGKWITTVDPTREHIELHPGLTLADERHQYQTFLHETAHAIQRHTEIKFRRQNRYYTFERPHGPIWHDIMVCLGVPAIRTHRIPEALRKAALHITPSGKVIDPSEGLTI